MLRLIAARTEAATTRHETLYGVDHLVVPVVVMVAGVHQPMGASGPELVTAESLARFVGGWNGRPVLLHEHPTQNGQPISAASPSIFDGSVVGSTFNAAMDGDRLKCEAWINLDRAANVAGAQKTIEKLESGTVVEISGSYFCETEMRNGNWNGTAYISEQTHLVPDHLAIDIDLGACSIAEGCGAPRSNCVGCPGTCKGEPVANTDDTKRESIILRALKRLIGTGARSNAEGESYRAVEEAINAALSVANPSADWVYVRDVFPDEGLVVYDIGDQPFQRSYTIDASGAVTLTGDPVAVVIKVNYTPAAAPPAEEAPMANETALVANATQEEIDALKAEIATLQAKLAEAKKEAETPVAAAAAPKLTDAELLAAMSPEMRAAIEGSMARDAVHKATLVSAMKAHAKSPYTEDQLKAMSAADLENLVKLAGIDTPAPDFSGLGGPRSASDDAKAPEPPVTWARKAAAA